ncbi:SDR family NAD(P)-dependent oxidoreductase [Pseudomonas sp. BIGb0427]|uniref:SDR family NAD(P)-dependent oxidoreductase n=1 Tax=unclassified Pseudomonas TaxID=196821 RepID=UPI0018A751FE|nr:MULTISPECIES: SDR family NAD(P)-dependent oxidoreductase [unclassified Pseudomonas]QPG61893.1 SDR family NAD(P)-dependent oxidoreductase [Pseudomonas sp. BIGb0427]UVM69374.1 SDR family NAD(P)-dependent oxidoreductase [Pseudomonas sp. B21-009]
MTLITNLAVAANTLVCGASEGIGLALCSQLLARDDVRQVFAVSRQANHSAGLEALARQHGRRLIRINCDARYEKSLEKLTRHIGATCECLHLVISTLGVLHDAPARAEKKLAQLDLASLQASFVTNSFAPILLLKHLFPLLHQPTTFAALSARVGSISDNRLGGWYSYRASKAALNQLLRTASIELKRLNPASTVLALHPGTTATRLSQPFQANVPPDKLFAPAFAAQCILELIARHGPAHSGTFWAWDHQPVAW